MKKMKSMSKKVLSWVLVFAMCTGTLQLSAFAAESGGEDVIELPLYNVETGEPTVRDFSLEAGELSGTWKSSNTGVLEVDENGVVTAIGTGEAVITLTAERETLGSLPEEEDEILDGEEQPEEGQDPDVEEIPGEGQDPGEEETPGEGQDPGEEETPSEGQDPGEEEIPGEDQDPDVEEIPGEGQDPSEEETPSEGDPHPPAGGDTGSSSDTGSGDTSSGDSGSGDSGSSDTGSGDSGSGDTGSSDTGSSDTGSSDSGSSDTGSSDTGSNDTGSSDSGSSDTGSSDSGSSDSGSSDTGSSDSGSSDSGSSDSSSSDSSSSDSSSSDSSSGGTDGDDPSGDFASELTDSGLLIYTWTVRVYDPAVRAFTTAAEAFLAELESQEFADGEELYAVMGEQAAEVMGLWEALTEEQQMDPEALEVYNAILEALGYGAMTLAEGTITFTPSSGMVKNGDVYTISESGTLEISGGVVTGRVVVNNGATVTITGDGTLDANKTGSVITVDGKATVNLTGNVTITGGTGQTLTGQSISGTFGGGVCVISGTFNMSGGTISGNTADNGGGIYGARTLSWGNSQDNSIPRVSYVSISGGTIEGNTARRGGGVCINWDGSKEVFTMTGGTISGNTADGNGTESGDWGGGGIWTWGTITIAAAANETVNITNNHSLTTKDWGGGGIYVNSNGNATIKNAVITGNTADGFGGGVSGCPHATIGLKVSNGAVIYGNTAKGLKMLEGTKVWDMGDKLAYGDTGFTAEKAMDFYCVETSAIQGQIGGMSGRVVRKDDGHGEDITLSADKWLVVQGESVGLTSSPETIGIGTVNISGNTSASHGGGIGCNGTLVFGTLTTTNETDNAWSINMTKVLKDVKGNSVTPVPEYTFNLWDSAKTNIVATAKNDADGNICFTVDSPAYAGTADGTTYTFYVQEADPADPNIKYDTDWYEVQVFVTQKEKSTTINGVTITSKNSFAKQVTAGITITNQQKPGSLKISKELVNPTLAVADEKFVFEVSIAGLEGKYGDYTFTNGKTKVVLEYEDSDTPMEATITGLPAGAKYTVKELEDKGSPNYTLVEEKTTGDTGKIVADGTAEASFTNKRDTASIVVTKVVDYNKQYSEKPTDEAFKITVTLGNGEGGEVEVSEGTKTASYKENGKYVFTLKDGESGTIENVPTQTEYTVEEETLAEDSGYKNTGIVKATGGNLSERETLDDGGVSVLVNNHYFSHKKTSVTVEKKWVNEGNAVMPASIEVQLYQNDRPMEGYTGTLTKDNGWTHTWTDLDMYPGENAEKPYSYTVKECSVSYEGIDGGYTADKRAEGSNIIRVRSSNATAQGVNEIVGGWIVNDTNAIDGNGTITLTNTWRGYTEMGNASFSVHKVDSDDSKTPIEGVEFTLTPKSDVAEEEDEMSPYVQTTDKNGNVKFEALPAGTYLLEETKVPAAYNANGNVGRKWVISFTKDQSEKAELQSVTELDPEDENSEKVVGENTWSWNATIRTGDENFIGEITIENQVIKGGISITKVIKLDGRTVSDVDFRGESYTFDLFEGALDAEALAAAEPLTSLTVKGYGETRAEAKDLRYGWYTIAERTPEDLDGYRWTGVSFEGVEGAVAVMKDGRTVGYQVFVGAQDQTCQVTASNSYTRGQGELHIRKTLSGNNADPTQIWHFTLALRSEKPYVVLEDTYYVTYSDGASSTITRDGSGLYHGIAMVGGVTAAVHGLPLGVSYLVTEEEANQDGYTTTAQKNGEEAESLRVSGTVEDGTADVVEYHNSRTRTDPGGPGPGPGPGRNPNTPGTPTTPDRNVPENPVPLTQTPEESMEVSENEVPLAVMPEEEEEELVEVPEEEVPLDVAPQTGDETRLGLWLSAAVASGAALLWLALSGRKREENQ